MLIRLLKVYQKAYDKKYSPLELADNDLHFGFCNKMYSFSAFKTASTFANYYKHLFKRNGYLYSPVGRDYKNLLPRIKFLKSEIKRLEKLRDKGYTHI